GREAEPVWVWKLVLGDDDVEPTAWIGAIHRGRQFAFPDGKAGGLADLRIKPPCRIARTSRDVRLSFVKLAAIGRVGKPDAAIGVRNGVIGRIEALAVEQVGDHRRRAVVLVADHAPRQMLAGNLPALEIEGVAVAVVGRQAKDADLTGFFEPAQLAGARDVAPHQIAALGTPGRALGPQRAGPQSLDRPVSLYVIPEEGIDDNYVGVPGVDVRRRVNAKVAGRAGDDARRDALFRLGHYAARARDRGAGRHGSNQCPARYCPALYLPALTLPLARHDDLLPKVLVDLTGRCSVRGLDGRNCNSPVHIHCHCYNNQYHTNTNELKASVITAY